MEHLFDIVAITSLVAGSSFYLWNVFKKARKNCGSICSVCSGSCKVKVKHFSAKTIPIKSVN